MALNRGDSKAAPILQETRKLIDHAISSLRTMSYLLHPPLLDEAGFDAAARWFIEGLNRRTGLRIEIDFSHAEANDNAVAQVARMPDAFELAMFRALQEGLTNVHRHSSSPNAVVRFQRLPDRAVLEIQDFGVGIPPHVMERFQRTGTGSGVGLAGIRERIKELGGEFAIQSNSEGTRLRAMVPLSPDGKMTAAETTIPKPDPKASPGTQPSSSAAD